MTNQSKYYVVCHEYLLGERLPKSFEIGEANDVEESVGLIHDFVVSSFENEMLNEGERKDHSTPKLVFIRPKDYDFAIGNTRQAHISSHLFAPGTIVILNDDFDEQDPGLGVVDGCPEFFNSGFNPELSPLRIFVILNNEARFLDPDYDDYYVDIDD